MRIVSILILLVLAGAVYIASSAPGSDGFKESSNRTVAALEAQGASRAVDQKVEQAGLPNGAAVESGSAVEAGLPTAFPPELKMRSQTGAASRVIREVREEVAAAGVGQGSEASGESTSAGPLASARSGSFMGASAGAPMDASTDASTGDHPSWQATRRGPILREPEVELDSSTVEALIAERLDSKPHAGRRPAREVRMPSKPAVVEPAEVELAGVKPAITEITLPAPAAPQDSEGQPEAAPDVEPIIELAGAVDSAPKLTLATQVAGSGVEIPVTPPAGDQGPLPVTTQGLRGSVVDSSGKGIANIQIDVVDVESREVALTMTAGVDGVFVAPDLASGRYALAVKNESVPLGISSPIGVDLCRTGAEPIGYGSLCVDVENMGSPTTVEMILPLSSGIQGTVLGQSGSPASGVLVRAISEVPGYGAHPIVAESNDEGFFFFSLVPGPYELQMLLPVEGKPKGLLRSMDVTAKPGSALLLETIDFSKKEAGKRTSKASPAPAGAEGSKAQEKVASSKQPIVLRSMPPALIGREPLGQEVLGEEVRPVEARASLPVRLVFQTGDVVLGDAPKKPVDLPGKKPSGEDPKDKEPEAEVAGAKATVELRGRVISKWGESLPALSVQAEAEDGTVLVMTQTSDEGRYVLEGVPVGGVVVRVASDLDINRKGPRGTTLLKRPRAMPIRTFSGQKRVTLEDVVVDVRRVYRLVGRIQIRAEALEQFKATIAPNRERRDALTDDQYRRAFLRGMRLVQKNRGAGTGPDSKRRQQSVPIASDGSFVWTCTLPADDILLVLEPRSSRKGAGYDGPIGIPVTPAGVRPATLELIYPAAKAADKKGDEGAKSRAAEIELDAVAPS